MAEAVDPLAPVMIHTPKGRDKPCKRSPLGVLLKLLPVNVRFGLSTILYNSHCKAPRTRQ